MILKTALGSKKGALNDIGTTLYSHLDGRYLFLCHCGEYFFLRDTNRFKSLDEIMCRDCKRLGRLLDNIGERYVYKRVKQDARAAGRYFGLTFEWFVKTIHEPCHYCGRTDTNTATVPSKTPVPLLKGFKYNGLDRIDNSIGYEESNCVSSCFICNRAKQSLPYDDFLAWISDVIEYRGNHK